MPERMVCGKCGTTLHEGTELKSPYEAASDYDGKCPKCARKLLQALSRIEIKPAADAQTSTRNAA